MEHPHEDLNRRYFVHYATTVARPGARVLDYGCGSGELVVTLREAGFDAYGCDISWPGSNYSWTEQAQPDHLKYFESGGPLPFADDEFDLVVSHQVFEHVEPIESSIPEIERVIKPDGIMYHHFPAREVWREGHIGIPFSHRFPKGKLRLYYTGLLRWLGAGIYKDERPALDWAAEKLEWIDNWTFYRPADELYALFGRHATVTHREIDYCRFRAGDRALLSALLSSDVLTPFVQLLFRRLGCMAIECRPNPAGEDAVATGQPVIGVEVMSSGITDADD